jgi:hypothetical protein
MRRRRTLAAVSAIQLAVGLAGAVTSVRRGHSYDLLWFHGNPARVAVEALTLGTALSAPALQLNRQATCAVAHYLVGGTWPRPAGQDRASLITTRP